MERDFFGNRKNAIAQFLIDSGLYIALSLTFFYKYRDFDIQESKVLWPVFWVNQGNVQLAVKLSLITMGLAPVFTFFKKTRLLGQIATVIAALFVISISYSNGKSYHSGLAWIVFMFSYFGVRFFTKPVQAVHFAFFVFSTAYLNSGIWKLRYLVQHLWETSDLSVMAHTLQEHVASSAVERMRPPSLLGQWVLDHLWLSAFLWIAAIGAELTPVLIPFFRKQAWVFALVMAGFHIGVLLTMRIDFVPSIALLFILSLYFYLQQKELVRIT